MPQSQGMGQMIQMITALAEMQDRRKRLALDQQQFEAQRDQFAVQLGFQKDSEHWKRASKLLDLIGEGGATAATAVKDLAPLAGFSAEEAEAFAHIAPSAQTALARVQAQGLDQDQLQRATRFGQQQAGFDSMGNPNATAQERAGQAAWLQQNAGGPGAMGELGASGLLAQMASQADQQINPASPSFNKDMSFNLAQGMLTQLSTRQDPWNFAVGRAAINQGLAPIAAQTTLAQTKPTANALLGAQMDQFTSLTKGSNTPRIAPADYVQIITRLKDLTENMAQGKFADKNTRKAFVQQYNSLAGVLGDPGVTAIPDDDAQIPGAVSRVTKLWNGMFGSGAPRVGDPIRGGVGGGMGGGGTGPRPPGGF